MKNKTNASIFNLLIAIAGLLLVGLACDSDLVSKFPPGYVGVWRGSDGSLLKVERIGASWMNPTPILWADYRAAGAIECINGDVNFSESEPTFTIKAYKSQTFRITESPTSGTMRLDNVVFKRLSADANASTASLKILPFDFERREMDEKTLYDWAKCYRKSDFTDFYNNNLAQSAQQSTTPAQLKTEYLKLLDDSLVQQIYEHRGNGLLYHSPQTLEDAGNLNDKSRIFDLKKNVEFDLSLVAEGSQWKVTHLSLAVIPAEKNNY